jgi:hypothetical protein
MRYEPATNPWKLFGLPIAAGAAVWAAVGGWLGLLLGLAFMFLLGDYLLNRDKWAFIRRLLANEDRRAQAEQAQSQSS